MITKKQKEQEKEMDKYYEGLLKLVSRLYKYYDISRDKIYIDNYDLSEKYKELYKTLMLDEETEKDLIAEVQQLRMENEYLKKLNALVQERIKRENKKK